MEDVNPGEDTCILLYIIPPLLFSMSWFLHDNQLLDIAKSGARDLQQVSRQELGFRDLIQTTHAERNLS